MIVWALGLFSKNLRAHKCTYEPLSKPLVSPLIAPTLVPNVIPYNPPLRSLDHITCKACGFRVQARYVGAPRSRALEAKRNEP